LLAGTLTLQSTDFPPELGDLALRFANSPVKRLDPPLLLDQLPVDGFQLRQERRLPLLGRLGLGLLVPELLPGLGEGLFLLSELRIFPPLWLAILT